MKTGWFVTTVMPGNGKKETRFASELYKFCTSLTGVYNFTNPGIILHNQVLDLFIKYIDPNFTYSNFSVKEQAKILKVDRSNNELDVTKLLRNVPREWSLMTFKWPLNFVSAYEGQFDKGRCLA